MSQDVLASPIYIDNVMFEVTDQFMCQVSTITNNLLLGLEIDQHITKAAVVKANFKTKAS